MKTQKVFSPSLSPSFFPSFALTLSRQEKSVASPYRPRSVEEALFLPPPLPIFPPKGNIVPFFFVFIAKDTLTRPDPVPLGPQDEIGDAIAECIDERIVSREELFVSSKLNNPYHR